MLQIILIAHNLRSCHNVGSLLRTADGLGIQHVYLTGYTPYPSFSGDTRMPHLTAKLTKQIIKTSLGAEKTQAWSHADDVFGLIAKLKADDYTVCALEQTNNSISLPSFHTPNKVVLLVGREVEGVEPEVLAACDHALEIPMFGKKESFNVVQAAAMALYHCRFAAHEA